MSDNWFKAAIARTILFRKAEQVVSTQGREAGWYEGGYRAQVVAYICARIARMAMDLSKGGSLDYQRLWSQQHCDGVLEQQLEVTGEVMMRVLRQPPREGQNISEWAKTQACREAALCTDVSIVDDFRAWMADRETVRARTRETRAIGHVDEDLRMITQVMKMPETAWSKLREFARGRQLLQPSDESALKAACGQSGRPPNEIQAKQLLALIERVRQTGWQVPEMEPADI